MQYNQPYGITDPNAAYINGNPATGTMGSIPPASSIEYDQREIVAVIKYAADHGLIDFNNQVCQQPSNADLTQLLKAIFGMTNQQKLQSNMTIYINSSTGDDTLGDGSTAKPYRTYQVAVNAAQARFDLNLKHTITFHGTGAFNNGISPAAGTAILYMAGLFAGQNGAGSVIFDNTAATFFAANGCCFYINQGAQVLMIGGTYSATSDGVTSNTGCAVQVGGMAIVMHYGGNFAACDVAHWFNWGQIWVVGGYTISGNAPVHIVAEPTSGYSHSNGPWHVVLVGKPNFSNCFASVYGGAVLGFGPGSSAQGLATGRQYLISGFGKIDTGGLGLPGDTAGYIYPNTGNGEFR